jgi:PilZ domain
MASFPRYRERRRTPRVDLLSEYRGHLITLDEEVTVLQLGPAGMTLSAAIPLSPAQVHDLRLTLEDCVLTLKVRVVHTRASLDVDEITYHAGVAFVDPPPDAIAAIREFLDSLPAAEAGEKDSKAAT